MNSSAKRMPKITANAPITLTFSLLCVVATLLSQVFGYWVNNTFFSVYRASLADPLSYLRLFTHVIGHSGWDHLFNNLLFVLLLGPMLEEKHGAKFMIFMILATALVTGLFTVIFSPATAMCGSSGVVFAMIILASFTQYQEGTIPLTVILVAALYLGEQIFSMVNYGGDIAYGAHIIGGIVGAVLGIGMNRRS